VIVSHGMPPPFGMPPPPPFGMPQQVMIGRTPPPPYHGLYVRRVGW
jgi:hypothetical protein